MMFTLQSDSLSAKARVLFYFPKIFKYEDFMISVSAKW